MGLVLLFSFSHLILFSPFSLKKGDFMTILYLKSLLFIFFLSFFFFNKVIIKKKYLDFYFIFFSYFCRRLVQRVICVVLIRRFGFLCLVVTLYGGWVIRTARHIRSRHQIKS